MKIDNLIINLLKVFLLIINLSSINGLREFRSWSTRHVCEMARSANYPFAFAKYDGQVYEDKARVNTNEQDFRHECQVRGGRSKCHICETIECSSEANDGYCELQLQGVNATSMSYNLPVAADTAWAVGGGFKRDFGGDGTTHFCVFLTGGYCVNPGTSDFTGCLTRCFGYGFGKPSLVVEASTRSITDVYPGMGKWEDDGQVDLWEYPKNCTELDKYQDKSCVLSTEIYSKPRTTDFNPQGFVFTVAGNDIAGFVDGIGEAASFYNPQDIALTVNNDIFVADTHNNAIRVINATTGMVTTIAGGGPDKGGYDDGPCQNATFKLPKGLDVKNYIINGESTTIIIVADTGNHRLRRIDYIESTGYCMVSCFSGLCGNNTLSETTFKVKAPPSSGYADGSSVDARFSAPESVTFMDNDFIAVADTGNYLIRWVSLNNGSTSTLAGSVEKGQVDPDGNPLAGCTPPCMVGSQGFNDGNLTSASFYNPVDVTRGTNNTIWVADEHRIRIIELPNVDTMIYGIHSMGRVSTIAGTALQGHEDGVQDKANFFGPSGVIVSDSNVAYVVDSSSCRIRRITPIPLVAELVTCATKAVELIRPSGCTSYDQPIDKVGRKVTRVEANIQYNYADKDIDKGKFIKNCVGTPPLDTLDKHYIDKAPGNGDNLVIDDHRTYVNEDSEQGMAIMIKCPSNCLPNSGNSIVEGTHWYSESSSICRAAIHDNVITAAVGGYIQITFQRRAFLWTEDPTFITGTTNNGVTSTAIAESVLRVFSIERFYEYMSVVHTVGGHPSAQLEGGCGYADAQPATASYFNKPRGLAMNPNSVITDKNFLYIADSANNRIRGMSAVCTQICENGGRCIAADICECPTGWLGIDCTLPLCSTPCGPNKVCGGPDLCICKPGFEGQNCDTAQCTQHCYNNGVCTAPDTCACAPGWFDTNCTTPVCSNTCANGGNCTAPNTCACPEQWTGDDCRIPVCTQECKNGGYCVAPDTCICPPQWINHDCAVPVCNQGYFIANPDDRFHHIYANNLRTWPTYKACNIESWCNATHEMECDQTEMVYLVSEVPSGPEWRAINGRKERPSQCMNIELPITYILPFELLRADNTTTGNRRYAPLTPYESEQSNPWRGLLAPLEGHTGPWVYQPDRQLANVNWLNMSEGVYVCANNGNCTFPGICECAEGWIGFDCRTPICSQGYYFKDQKHYVSGEKTNTELLYFEKYLGSNNSYRLNWPYSNPNYTMQWEFYVSATEIRREIRDHGGIQYNAVSNWTSGKHEHTSQGGYRCSIRSVTQFENLTFTLSHPNYYSRYMNRRIMADGNFYTFWDNMLWPPVNQKSRILEQTFFNITYAYTNEGWRRYGIWNITEETWQYGICMMEFRRNCTDPMKQLDLQSNLFDVLVQDTDLAYRPRLYYNDLQAYGVGRWNTKGGECIDEVIRGCYNNGTCVGPDTCSCAEGWSGSSCNIPLCKQTCNHNGKCTLPDICTCEKGWEGEDCSIPICAQECQNGGYCIAPDTCKCFQWFNDFRDGRLGGGRPLFMDPQGFPLNTGWTGYDCSSPICVQNDKFVLNIPGCSVREFAPTPKNKLGDCSLRNPDNPDEPAITIFKGHGGDGTLECKNEAGEIQPRCPQFDEYVTGNEGATFQSGCGYDPFDTGCCICSDPDKGCTPQDAVYMSCYVCNDGEESGTNQRQSTNNTFFCQGNPTVVTGLATAFSIFVNFRDAWGNYKMCGKFHSPRNYLPGATDIEKDYGVAAYYRNRIPKFSSYNFKSNYTSQKFLCDITGWQQGDYIDDAGMGNINGVGSIYGLKKGRHIRYNSPYIKGLSATEVTSPSERIASTLAEASPGEGIYACYNEGSCIGPDICTCTDGYEGYDCNTPLCRHLQPSGDVSSCLNGGICINKDNCNCVQSPSVLSIIYPDAAHGITGWTGTDCSIPMCTQGFFDPFCTDLPQAPAGEGCYRCGNGGNCTAPDICTCAPGWSGFDCRTPLCEVIADPLTRTQLGTYYEDKVISFETDPCGLLDIYGMRGWHGRKYARGNCTKPNECTCLCKLTYSEKICHKTEMLCEGPWQDPMVALRNVLIGRGPEFTFGTTDCQYGYEGNVDFYDKFVTCHQTIYLPTGGERSSIDTILGFSVSFFAISMAYYFISSRIKRRMLMASIERRRSKRSSEESLLEADKGGFTNK